MKTCVVIFLLPLLICACSFSKNLTPTTNDYREQSKLDFKRDLTTPSLRLIGHWKSKVGDNLYYSAIDTSQGIGSYFLVQPNGNVAHYHYSIVSEMSNGERVKVKLLNSDDWSRVETYYISKDGKRMIIETVLLGFEVSATLEYIDSKITPE
jgi:hypothetical protein